MRSLSTQVLLLPALCALACSSTPPDDETPTSTRTVDTETPATPTAAKTPTEPSSTPTHSDTATAAQGTPTAPPPTATEAQPTVTAAVPTPAPTPVPTPAPIGITKLSVDLQCGSGQWQFQLDVEGKVKEGSARFEIFDFTETCETYASPPAGCYRELHPLTSIEAVSDVADTISLTLDEVESADLQVAGASTAFSCGNLSELTFVACVDDEVQNTPEVCLFFGHEIDYWTTNARPATTGGSAWLPAQGSWVLNQQQ